MFIFRVLFFVVVCSQIIFASDPRKTLGRPAGQDGGYGRRSVYVKDKRVLQGDAVYSARSRTPLQSSYGTLTPSGLHFERHHAGIPDVDPSVHRVLVRGMVKNPKVYTVDDLKRFPSVIKQYFLECAGNTRSEWKSELKAVNVQDTHGLMSHSEWVGVPLSTVLKHVGVDPKAVWVIVEGADASGLIRSLPLSKCLDDVLIAYAQNGEPLRPEQGFPLRLVVPGWEGNCWIKWLTQLYVTDRPYMTQQETSKYTDLRKDGKADQFTFTMGVKSVLTFPSGGEVLPGKGFYSLSGLAWSGHGKIIKVEVSVDGGRSWVLAKLSTPIHTKSHTRFSYDWQWDGKPCVLQSRSYDDQGNRQPSRKELLKHGPQTDYHWNGIQSWSLDQEGNVKNHHEELL
ncbi:MAG: sulfite dehydrogenase [Oligoflexales bacterium]